MLSTLGQWLRDLFSHIPSDSSAALQSSLIGSWYLHPDRHVWEFVFLNLLCIGVVYYLGRRPWDVVVPAAATSRRSATTLDWLTFATCLTLLIATITYKILTERLIYMLQPCHMWLMTLLYLSVTHGVKSSPKGGSSALDIPSIVFNVYIHNTYGAWLALATPGAPVSMLISFVCLLFDHADTRDLKLPFEVFSFFFEHALLVGLPLVYLVTRRFNVYKPRVFFVWAAMFLYHVDILLPVSLIAGSNLNYMMVRQPSC